MKASTKKWMLQSIFILYLIILCYLLFFSENYGRTDISEAYRYNLVLFREIRRFYDHRGQFPWMYFVNIYGNILAFMPFGYLLPALSERLQRVGRAMLLVFGASLTAETIQLVYKVGTFDVDDLVLNTLGGLLGYLVWRVMAWCFFRKRKLR